MAAGPAPTPQEAAEAMARDVSPEMRIGAMLQSHYGKFHDVEATLTHMFEIGYLSGPVYAAVMASRFSFRQSHPARAMPDFMRVLGEVRNAGPLLQMVSQSVGARRIGQKVVPIRRKDVPGMDARSVFDVINEPLVREELSFGEGMAIIRELATKMGAEGDVDEEDMEEVRQGFSAFHKALDLLGLRRLVQ